MIEEIMGIVLSIGDGEKKVTSVYFKRNSTFFGLVIQTKKTFV